MAPENRKNLTLADSYAGSMVRSSVTWTLDLVDAHNVIDLQIGVSTREQASINSMSCTLGAKTTPSNVTCLHG